MLKDNPQISTTEPPVFKKVEHRKWRMIALAIVTGVMVSGASAYILLSSGLLLPSRQADSKPSSLLKSPPEVKKISADGRLEPDGEIIHLFPPTNLENQQRISQLVVKAGDPVKSGQVVAILDFVERRQAALAIAQKQVQIARLQLKQVQTGAKQGNIQAQDARRGRSQAELEGQIAIQHSTLANLAAKLDGEKGAQEATLKRIAAELRHAQTNCRRYRTLYQQKVVAEQERYRICLVQETTQASHKEAQANLDRIVRTLQAQIREAQANLDRTIATAKQQIKEDRATLKAVTEVRPIDVRLAQAELEASQASVQQAQHNLNAAYVRSPITGKVLKIHTRPGEVISHTGIANIGQTDRMYVVAEIYETDITKVRLGQSATISSPALSGKMHGQVVHIGLEIGRKNVLNDDPVVAVDARVVEVKIRLDPSSSQRAAGLSNLKVDVILNI
jgi:HlyD family secretion protein